uniref:Uncharacterized protein n=1 Tax=Anguilla anguilla TaxID=7936 RepID=A0A0E9TB16_ANGAN
MIMDWYSRRIQLTTICEYDHTVPNTLPSRDLPLYNIAAFKNIIILAEHIDIKCRQMGHFPPLHICISPLQYNARKDKIT